MTKIYYENFFLRKVFGGADPISVFDVAPGCACMNDSCESCQSFRTEHLRTYKLSQPTLQRNVLCVHVCMSSLIMLLFLLAFNCQILVIFLR